MNTRWIVPAALVMLVGTTACSRGDDPPTKAERVAITRQVMKTAMAMKTATEHMDPDLFTKFCVNSPDFLYVSPYGEAFNFAQSQKFWSGLVYTFKSQTDHLTKSRVIVLSRRTALFYWEGHVSGTAKNGDVFTTGPYSGTDVFRKIGNTWKVVYIQESGPPPKQSNQGKPATGKN